MVIMKDKAYSALVNRITKGTVSKSSAYRRLNSLEKKYGHIDMLYDVDVRTDQAYYDELLSDFRMGIYSKESISKMIEIRASQKKLPVISYSAIAGIIVLALIVITVVSIVIWRS